MEKGEETAGVRKKRIVRTSEVIAPAYHALWQDVRAGGHREYWLRGGRGSGKSSFISAAILCGMLRNRDASAMIFRRVAATLRESVYAMNACSGSRIARIAVSGTSEATAGQLVLHWVKNLTDGSSYTSAAIWIQCSMMYWVD